MAEFNLGSFIGSLAVLYNKGVRFKTVIDLGCADGHFYLQAFASGLLPGTVGVNVDANAIYQSSLREIQGVLGGHYVMAAVSDQDGEIELRTGSHFYWGSTVPADSSYWAGPNKPGEIVKVKAVTLDTLVQELGLEPPFLLKLDIQGGEMSALRGGQRMLAETDAIICESEPAAFVSVLQFLHERNFGLFDLTNISRLGDGVMCEFYPVFLNNRIQFAKEGLPADLGPLMSQMNERRAALLKQHAEIIAEFRRKLASARPV